MKNEFADQYAVKWGSPSPEQLTSSGAGRCPITGEAIPSEPAWGVFSRCRAFGGPFNRMVSINGAEKVAPELHAILALLRRDVMPNDLERSGDVVVVEFTDNGGPIICPVTGAVVKKPRPFDVFTLAGGRYSKAGAERVAPTLAAALNRYFQTEPERQPEPVPVPELSAEAKAAQARDHQRGQALNLLAKAFNFRGDASDPDSQSRARDVIRAFRLILLADLGDKNAA